MALPTFDASKHHIGLGTSAGTKYGFMLEGGYTKEVQREQSGQAPELGGQTDLVAQTPSLSRWTQDDFVGGMFAYNWGKDDAMFADCTGFMPNQQARSLLSCPPLVLKEAVSAGSTIRSMFMRLGYIYIVTPTTIHMYHIDTDTATSVSAPAGCTYKNVEYDDADQKLWAFCDTSIPADRPTIVRYNVDLSLPSYDFIWQGPTGTAGHHLIGGTVFNEYLICQIGRKIYVGDPPDNPDPTTVNTPIKWRKLRRLPGRWKDHVAFNNQLYILINDGSYRSQIWSFDGDNLLPVVEFPFAFYGKCMVEYAGRLFVGGTGSDVNGLEQYAELYEVTGASVRAVRTFSPETRGYFETNATAGWPTAIDDLVVHEGLLWFCQKGKRLVAYDVTGDSFFGAAEILGDEDLQVKRFTAGRGRIWMYATGDTNGIYRIAQASDSPSTWYPTFVTSDFVYEIAMLKRWSEMQVMTRYGSVYSIEYSTNSGGSWTSLTVTNSSSGQVYFAKADLSAIAASKTIRFRIKLTSTGDAGAATTYHRELVAYTVSFSMAEETRKKAWGFTINGSHFIETLDAEFSEATVQDYTPSEVRDQLWSWMSSQTNLVLKDLDGSDYNVKIEALREVMPVIGPDGGDEPEAHYALTLLEV